MSSASKGWVIEITYCDEANNGFVKIGHAAWDSEAEWNQVWDGIPESPDGVDDSDCLCVDKVHFNGDLLTEKFITARTAQLLLGQSLDAVIKDARQMTSYRMQRG